MYLLRMSLVVNWSTETSNKHDTSYTIHQFLVWLLSNFFKLKRFELSMETVQLDKLTFTYNTYLLVHNMQVICKNYNTVPFIRKEIQIVFCFQWSCTMD